MLSKLLLIAVVASSIIFVTALTSTATTAYINELPPVMITVGDSEWVNLTYNITLEGVTSNNPTVSFILTLSNVSTQCFNYSQVLFNAELTYSGTIIANLTNTTSITKNATSEVIQLSNYYAGSVPYNTFNLIIHLRIKALAIYGVSNTWFARIVVSSGSQAYLVQRDEYIHVKVIGVPPKVSLRSIEPKPAIMAPGTIVNMSISAYDASKVKSVSLQIVSPSGKPIFNWSSGAVGLVSYSSPIIEVNTSGWGEGNYTVIVKAYDELNLCNMSSVTTLVITKTFKVPSTYFKNLTQLIKHSGFLPGSTALVVGKVMQSGPVSIDKPCVKIVGTKGAVVEVASNNAFIISSENVTIANLTVKCSGTAFVINMTQHTLISGVNAVASRFINVIAPLNNMAFWEHRVVNSTLNGSLVIYRVMGGVISNVSSIEAHLLFGNYSVFNSSISNLYMVNSSVNTYDTPVTSVESMVNSNLTTYWSLNVKVLFAGKPVNEAVVRVVNNVTSLTLTTGSKGSVRTYLMYSKYVNGTKVLVAGNTTVTASKYIFSAKASCLVNKPTRLTLNLPAPKTSMELLSMKGVKVFKLYPGEVCMVRVNVSLTAPYIVEVKVMINGKLIADISKLSTVTSNVFLVMTPYEVGNVSITANVLINGMPPITAGHTSLGVSR